MTAALVTSALLLGLAGGPHCAVMCGALQAGMARRATPGATRRAMVWLHGGRLIGYAAAGAVVAASMSALSSLGTVSPALRPVWTLAQVAALAFGGLLMVTGRVPAWRWPLRWRPTREATLAPVTFVRRVPQGLATGAAGACWAVMPCGLLQSALVVAALADSAAHGAGVMTAFAIGTSLSLLAAGTLWRRLGIAGATASRAVWPVRAAGALLAAGSAYALFHGLGTAVQQALCG